MPREQRHQRRPIVHAEAAISPADVGVSVALLMPSAALARSSAPVTHQRDHSLRLPFGQSESGAQLRGVEGVASLIESR